MGWGGLPQIFDEGRPEWDALRSALKSATTSAEYAALRRSTQDAHYTPENILRAIWAGVERLGFQGGRILEPAAGIGHFFGTMPEAIRKASHVIAVELDPTSAAIAALLYPGVQLHGGTPFQQFSLAPNSIDLAIGNPPFGSQLIFDSEEPEISGLSLHNYFFAKSLLALRPGGILAMIVSTYLLDAENTRARAFLHQHATLLGAIRVPNTVFKGIANTDVSTDVLFLRKRFPGEPPDAIDWINTLTIADPAGGEPIRTTPWFQHHPRCLLGRIERRAAGSRPGAQITVTPLEDGLAGLPAAIESLPREVYRALETPASVPPRQNVCDAETLSRTKVYGFCIDPHSRHIYRRLPDCNGEPQAELRHRKTFGMRNDHARLAWMIQLRDLVIEQIEMEIAGALSDAAIEKHRHQLLKQYDYFRSYFGYLRDPGNKPLMREDPQWPLLLAIETHYDKGLSREAAALLNVPSRPRKARQGMILKKRVRWPYVEPTSAENAHDALLISLAQRGRMDLDYMRALTGRSETDLTVELGSKVFRDPERGWQTRDEYLSGPVKEKLRIAEARVAEGAAEFGRNVDALRAVIPADIAATDIGVRLGAPWLPPKVLSAFALHLFGKGTRAKFCYLAAAGRWSADLTAGSDIANSQKWGTPRKAGTELFTALINSTPIRVLDTTKDDRLVLNDKETQNAQDAANRIEAEFTEWLWKDAARRSELTRLYNDRYNTHVERIYDGSHLGRRPDGHYGPLPGQNPAIRFRAHQRNAIWRVIQTRGGLFDHVVGAGKTFAVIASVMELRRLGLVQRPMVTVPNHLVGQWAADWLTLYPGARVLVPSKEDFQRERRQQLLALIAAAEWDAVILAHSSFGFIDMPLEEFECFVTQQVSDIAAAIALAEANEGKSRTIKEMERLRESLTARLEAKLEARERDKVLDFSQLGIDFLAVDEAHLFKNLMFSTALRNVAGLGSTTGSQKAIDLFVKTQYIQRHHDHRNVLFATGTPISNSIAEVYTLQRYLQYPRLRALQISHFDAWQQTFARRKTDWEIDATGSGYRLKERLSEFTNLPELSGMYREFADVITRGDIDAVRAAQGLKSLTPPLKGGGPQNLVLERSEAQGALMEAIVKRAENLKSSDQRDNMLVITNDARKLALDIRVVHPEAADHPGSKVNRAVEEIFSRWQRWKEWCGTQLVFCDLSTPKSARSRERANLLDLQTRAAAGEEAAIEALSEYSIDELTALNEESFDVYNDLRSKLIGRGVPEEEIVFIHEAHTDTQRDDLFERVRAGRVRILMGSTSKMGAGMNVQTRLVAEHHLDAPWKPSEVEQREGRIIRQGNLFYEGDETTPAIPDFEIEILRYATSRTYDARMWQTIEGKALFVTQFRKGTSQRAAEDISAQAASAADMKAAASGNPLIIEEVKLRAEASRLENLRRMHSARRHRLEDIIRYNGRARASGEAHLASVKIDAARVITVPEGQFAGITVRGTAYSERRSGGNSMISEIVQMQRARQLERGDVAQYRGFAVSIELDEDSLAPRLIVIAESGRYRASYDADDTLDAIGLIRRLDHVIDGFAFEIERALDRLRTQERELVEAQAEVDHPFEHETAYQTVRERHQQVLTQLKDEQRKVETPPAQSPAVA